MPDVRNSKKTPGSESTPRSRYPLQSSYIRRRLTASRTRKPYMISIVNLINSSWCASGNGKKAELLLLDLGYGDYSISAISTQGAVTEKSWVSSYLVYLRSQHEILYLLADDKGNIKVAFMTNVLCSYLKLVTDIYSYLNSRKVGAKTSC